MKIIKKIDVPNHIETLVELVCDRCKNNPHRTYNNIKKCIVCGRDVCHYCAVVTEGFQFLDKPDFLGDYPDFICKECWDTGKEVREKIIEFRKHNEELEEELIASWKRLCLSET